MRRMRWKSKQWKTTDSSLKVYRDWRELKIIWCRCLFHLKIATFIFFLHSSMHSNAQKCKTYKQSSKRTTTITCWNVKWILHSFFLSFWYQVCVNNFIFNLNHRRTLLLRILIENEGKKRVTLDAFLFLRAISFTHTRNVFVMFFLRTLFVCSSIDSNFVSLYCACIRVCVA